MGDVIQFAEYQKKPEDLKKEEIDHVSYLLNSLVREVFQGDEYRKLVKVMTDDVVEILASSAPGREKIVEAVIMLAALAQRFKSRGTKETKFYSVMNNCAQVFNTNDFKTRSAKTYMETLHSHLEAKRQFIFIENDAPAKLKPLPKQPKS